MALGVRGKLFVSFTATILLMGGVGFLSWYNALELEREAKRIYNNQVLGAVSLANIESSLWSLRWGLAQFLLETKDRDKILADETRLYDVIRSNLQNVSQIDLTPTERSLLEKIRDSYEKYAAARPRWFELVKAGKLEEAATYRAATTTTYGRETNNALSELINLQRKVAEQVIQEVQQKSATARTLMFAALITALSATGILAWLISRDITRSILSTVEQVTNSSVEIGATVNQQEQAISQQAASVSQTTTAMSELRSSSRQSAEQAASSATAANQTLKLSEVGTQSVNRTRNEIAILKEKVEAIAEQIMNLSEQTSQITGITDLMSDIANQTNMLSLNAAVEAARAGDQGKGFAVVASEIRKLADQSKNSAEKIAALIRDIQASINTTVMVTDEGTKAANAGLFLVEETTKTFADITAAVNNVFLNNQQIALSAKQQDLAVQQVLEAINLIHEGTQLTSVSISQVKTSTEQLKMAAKALQNVIVAGKYSVVGE